MTPHSRALLEHRDELLAEAKRCGLTNVRVFGSIARGDADENGDVDLLVAVVPGTAGGFRRLGLPVLARALTGRNAGMLFESQLKPELGERASQARVRTSILEDALPL